MRERLPCLAPGGVFRIIEAALPRREWLEGKHRGLLRAQRLEQLMRFLRRHLAGLSPFSVSLLTVFLFGIGLPAFFILPSFRLFFPALVFIFRIIRLPLL